MIVTNLANVRCAVCFYALVEKKRIGALEAARADAPEVVLLDIGLPGMDGYEVARRLREQFATSPIVLVALTGYGQESDLRQSQKAGFDHHLVKPGDLGNVLQILATVSELSAR